MGRGDSLEEEANRMDLFGTEKVLGDTELLSFRSRVRRRAEISQKTILTPTHHLYIFCSYRLDPEALWGEDGPCCLPPR
jgi:hypothetical protein